MHAGQEIGKHRAHFVATVEILEGRLRFVVGTDAQSREEALSSACGGL